VTRRYRSKKVKPGQLIAYYGMADGDGPDVCFAWGEGCSKRDGALLYYHFTRKIKREVYGEEQKKNGGFPYVFDPSFIEELVARGYDITTIKFSIERKVNEADTGVLRL
jgi:hypothetical protein